MTRMRGFRGIVVPVVLGALAFGACGDDDSSPSEDAAEADDGAGDAQDFVGLTTEEAIAQAEEQDRPWRIGREDDQEFPGTLDFVENRVTFEIDDGVVTSASFG